MRLEPASDTTDVAGGGDRQLTGESEPWRCE